MQFHPLFKWLGDEPSDAGIGRVSRFAYSLGFDVRPCTSTMQHDGISNGDPDAVLEAWAAASADRLKKTERGDQWRLAGGWFTNAGQAVALFVRPTTDLAKALWMTCWAAQQRDSSRPSK